MSQGDPRSARDQSAGEEEVPTLAQISGLLVIACVFGVVGGFLDAYAWLAHGHVFANTQTGNVVMFAIHASDHDWVAALRALPPIGAFILGVSTARLVGAETRKTTFGPTLLCQMIEWLILAGLVAYSGSMRDAWTVPVLAFATGLQHTSFAAIGPWTFASTMTTGNITNAASGATLWWMGRKRIENRRRAAVSSALSVAFLCGALSGAAWTRHHARVALLPCLCLVGVGIALTWRQRRQALKRMAATERESARERRERLG